MQISIQQFTFHLLISSDLCHECKFYLIALLLELSPDLREVETFFLLVESVFKIRNLLRHHAQWVLLDVLIKKIHTKSLMF